MPGRNPISVRRLLADDAAELLRLRQAALRARPDAFLSDADDEAATSAEAYAARIDGGNDNLVVGALAAGRLVGMGGFRREARRKQRHRGSIWGMFVEPAWQRQGVGARILDALITHARAQPGLDQLQLGVVVGNDAARRLYLSRGFQPYAIDPAALRLDGRDLDDELMVLDLTAPAADHPVFTNSRLCGFIIDCSGADLDAAAAFWSAALGMPERRLPGSEGRSYRRLLDPLHRLHVEVQVVDHPSRVHLDIEADDVDAEVARLESLGASRVARVQSWWVMQAPTGQRFCVVRRQPAA
jgi:RimJ/RimL family protein N-acetyltransferase